MMWSSAEIGTAASAQKVPDGMLVWAASLSYFVSYRKMKVSTNISGWDLRVWAPVTL